MTQQLAENQRSNQLNILPGEFILGVATHPDDFSVFHSGMAVEIQRLGGIVKIAYVSDGNSSSKGDQDFVRSGGRRLEAVAESLVMGVTLDSIIFLDMPDGPYTHPIDREALSNRFIGLLRHVRPAAIFTPGEAGVDEHLGHIAAHRSMVNARDRLAVNGGYETPIWGLNIDGGGELVIPVDENIKQLAIAQNPSQFPNTITDAGVRFNDFALRELSFYALRGLMQVETYDRY